MDEGPEADAVLGFVDPARAAGAEATITSSDLRSSSRVLVIELRPTDKALCPLVRLPITK
jgi:hypothetical protein